MTDLNSTHDRLVAAAQAGLQELTATLKRKVEELIDLTVGRSEEEQARLMAKARGIQYGLSFAQKSVSPTVAYWDMVEFLPTVSPETRPGLEIAIQDARLISRL